ncbi:hypothetical protein R5W23_002338 [Gemmata sp. JC673]|uniref:Twin-arginine translocation signal domain-containing protein n=1 Tax=Gemmata algarum TaxID=2975278 RepID=A0ABU5F1M0_9BACT|nr:hypothetical protein [Gemmata algarum]MDY3561079.1 hypothetical protein [Gemmata algarum]
MNRTRRAFLRAAVVSPVIAGAWVVWEAEAGRLKVRQKPGACCAPAGVPNRSCTHLAPPTANRGAM